MYIIFDFHVPTVQWPWASSYNSQKNHSNLFYGHSTSYLYRNE